MAAGIWMMFFSGLMMMMSLSARKMKREDATKGSFKGQELHLVSTPCAIRPGRLVVACR